VGTHPQAQHRMLCLCLLHSNALLDGGEASGLFHRRVALSTLTENWHFAGWSCRVPWIGQEDWQEEVVCC
jgi:hypothetical protein